MPPKNHELPASDHFELHQLAAGIFAAIATEDGAAYSNAGIIDLGDQTLIFDTFETLLAAQDLKSAAEQLTGRQASCIIISHAHDDHWMGNQVFAASTPIIATHETYLEMLESAEEIWELQENPSEFEEMIREKEAQLETETDERVRSSLKKTILRYRYALEMLPGLELRFPTQTFNGKLVFHGTSRNAELITKGSGHTSSDSFLFLQDEKIVFLGDLGFFGSQPFIAYSDSQAWLKQLHELEGINALTFVPGHGPLGTKADLDLQVQYIVLLEELVSRTIREGGSVEDALQQPLPEPFDSWLYGGIARFEANVRYTYERLSGNKD